MMQPQPLASSAIAVGRPDGGPVRLRRNGRQRRAVGLYFSVKSGGHLPHESTLELHDLWRAEVDSSVLSSWPQPFTLQLVSGGKVWRYTPDRRDVMADGSERIVEVKPNGWARLDAAYAARLAAVGEVLEAQGLRFCVHDQSAIEAEPAFSAIRAIQLHRRTAITATDLLRVRDWLGQDGLGQNRLGHGERTLGEVQAVLGGGPQAFAVVCAMVVHRMLWLDFLEGLHAGCPVGLVR